ncbi:MAG: ATPase domain-containing protein [Candidatus Woesearchaeota archaeon]
MKTKITSIDLERDELNRNLGGGIPNNSLILIEGKDGAGKSILVQRLSFGLLKHEKSVTYISSELNTTGFIEQMSSLDYDIKFELLDGNLMFIPMFPFLGNTKLRENFLEKLFNTKKIFENEIIIFDTFSFLLVKDNIAPERSFQIINMLKKLNNLNKTIIFCVDPDHLNEKFLTLLRSVADIYFNVEIRTFAGNLIRAINVKRYKRSADYIVDVIPFKVEPGKGLAIEIASFS